MCPGACGVCCVQKYFLIMLNIFIICYHNMFMLLELGPSPLYVRNKLIYLVDFLIYFVLFCTHLMSYTILSAIMQTIPSFDESVFWHRRDYDNIHHIHNCWICNVCHVGK